MSEYEGCARSNWSTSTDAPDQRAPRDLYTDSAFFNLLQFTHDSS